MRKKLAFVSVLVFGAAVARAQASDTASGQGLVNQYCQACHNDKVKSGGFSWAKVDLTHPDQSSEELEKVIRKLRAGLMPPPGMPRPDVASTKAFVAALESGIDQAAAAHPNPGRPALHRLNRTEYANSIRDLLDLKVDVAPLLPADDMSHGFDNMADALNFSPALMDAYIRTAGKISRLAVGDIDTTPSVTTYQLSKNVSQLRHVEGAPIGTRGGLSVIHQFPIDAEYVFKMTFYYSVDGPLFGKSQGKGQQIEVSINGERVALLDIDPKRTKWDDLQTAPIKVKAGPQRVSAAFIQHFEGPLEDIVTPIEYSLVDLNEADMAGLTSLPHLHDLAIGGPYNASGLGDTPSRRKIFTCRPSAGDDVDCAKKIISRLARQAYRRPPDDSDIEELMNLYVSERNRNGFEAGVRMAVQAMIANPKFIFRFEPAPENAAPGSNYRISDLELASRLSYFLWSSAPDDQLISLASQSKLREGHVLEQQVRRMLADPKSEALSTNFAAEWLHLQNLRDAQPDAYLYPNFDSNLAQSMQRETELFFNSFVREDRNVLELLTANYTFVDEILAKHYKLPNVLGTRFRRVQISDENRLGLLGQASILTLTSVSNRSSPVQRGKYVLEVLLGTPPPPPPPNVPALAENASSGEVKLLSVRERMEAHRKNANCAACHKLIDPIGFALENFDAVGAWRINDSGLPVDTKGQLFDGTKLDGPASLRQAILNHSDAFVGTFTENLLAYGLGRVIDYRDMPTVRSIELQAAREGNRFSSFILGIVNSASFQTSRAEGSAPVDVTGVQQNESSKPPQALADGNGSIQETKGNVHH
jgi:mono/diheme cytochrome c family protein